HPEAIYCIFLMLLAFSPAGRCLSLDAWLFGRRSNRHAPPLHEGGGIRAVDTTAQWPLTAATWLMARGYLCAGLAKLKVGGLEWFNGDTLQWYLLQDGKRWGSDLGLWLATQKELCIAISIGAVAFEVGFPIVLYFRR